jgi:hypothetical protein
MDVLTRRQNLQYIIVARGPYILATLSDCCILSNESMQEVSHEQVHCMGGVKDAFLTGPQAVHRIDSVDE